MCDVDQKKKKKLIEVGVGGNWQETSGRHVFGFITQIDADHPLLSTYWYKWMLLIFFFVF